MSEKSNTAPTVVRGRVRAVVWRAANGNCTASTVAMRPDYDALLGLARKNGGWVQIERLVEGEPGRVLL